MAIYGPRFAESVNLVGEVKFGALGSYPCLRADHQDFAIGADQVAIGLEADALGVHLHRWFFKATDVITREMLESWAEKLEVELSVGP